MDIKKVLTNELTGISEEVLALFEIFGNDW
jgi:hypothetical protein